MKPVPSEGQASLKELDILGKSKKFMHFVGCKNKNQVADIQTDKLFCQSKTKSNVEILFGTITRPTYPEIRKSWQGVCMGIRIKSSVLVHDSPTIEV